MATQLKSEAIQRKIDECKKTRDELNEAYGEAQKPWMMKLAEERRKHEPGIDALDKRIEKLRDELREAQAGEEFAAVMAKHAEVVKAGEFDKDNAFDYLQGLLGQRIYTTDNHLTKYANGTSVLRLEGSYSREVRYYFFHGLRLVGFNWTQRSAHPGDPQESLSWLGIPTPSSKNIMRGEKTLVSRWGDERTTTRPLTMRDIVDRLKSHDGKTFKSIDLKKEKTRELLAKGVPSIYGEW